jgi:hypothetical protein
MQNAAASLSPDVYGGLGNLALGTSTNTTHDNSVVFGAGAIVIQANSAAEGAAAADGLLGKLRSYGIRVGV